MDDQIDVLKQCIKKYVESETVMDDKLKSELEDSIYEKARKQIIKNELDRITAEAASRIKQEERRRKITNMKALIIEGLLVALVIGLIVNQSTEVISLLKGGDDVNLLGTIITLIMLVCLGGTVMFLSYLNKFADILFDSNN